MGDLRSVQAEKIYKSSQAGGYNVEKLNTNEYNGRVRLFYAHFEAKEAIAASKVIDLIDVPAGRILPTSKVYFGAGGQGSTLDVGYAAYVADDGTAVAADGDALLDGGSTATAGSLELAANPAGIVLTGKATITATTAAFAQGKAIDAFIFCAVD